MPERPMHAVGTLEGVIGSVRAGGGIAVLPRSYLDSVPGTHELSQIALPEKFRTVEIFIMRLRKKLDDGRREPLIETVRGVGYVLKPPA